MAQNKKRFNIFKALMKVTDEAVVAFVEKKLKAELKAVAEREAKWVEKMDDKTARERLMGKFGKREMKKRGITPELGIKQVRAMLTKANQEEAEADMNKTLDTVKRAFAKPMPDSIRVDEEWKKSRTWGNCPTVEVWMGGEYGKGHASGCGYDKESAAAAMACNDILASVRIIATCAYIDMLESKATGETCKTYGYNFNIYHLSFEGGVGYNCHKSIICRAGFDLTGEFHPKSADGWRYSRIPADALPIRAKELDKEFKKYDKI